MILPAALRLAAADQAARRSRLTAAQSGHTDQAHLELLLSVGYTGDTTARSPSCMAWALRTASASSILPRYVYSRAIEWRHGCQWRVNRSRRRY